MTTRFFYFLFSRMMSKFPKYFPPQKRDIICGRPLTFFYVKLHNKFMQLIFQVNGLKVGPDFQLIFELGRNILLGRNLS